MKTKEKLMRSFLSLAVAIAAVALLGSVNAQAKSSFKYDAKKGIVWEPALRTAVGQHTSYSGTTAEDAKQEYKTSSSDYKNPLYFYMSTYGSGFSQYRTSTTVYVADENAKVTAKSNSGDLLVKVSYSRLYTGNSYASAYSATSYHDYAKEQWVYNENLKNKEFKSVYGIEYFAKKAGNYTITVTVKKGKKKLATKKIKIYASEYTGPVDSVKYGGNIYGYGYGSSFSTTKKSGGLKIKMNKGYKLNKIEVGTYRDVNIDSSSYEDYPEIKWKKLGNGKKLKLNTKTKYKEVSQHKYSQSTSTSTYQYNYLNPVTPVRITYSDTWTGQTKQTSMFYITYIK